MLTGVPSRTALIAASHRATHQVAEGGHIFWDPLAGRIFQAAHDEALPDISLAEAVLPAGDETLARRPMRLFIAVRSRLASEYLQAAAARGVRQFVVLGAGLDTTAYRDVLPTNVRVYEVDHPATQAWKQEILTRAGIGVPDGVHFVPVDFEKDVLISKLTAAGFDVGATAFFIWLGVVPYLTRQAILDSLAFVAALAAGAEIIFDYSNPLCAMDAVSRLAHEARAERVNAMGEAWISHFETDELHGILRGLGFARIDDFGAAEIAARFFPGHAGRHGGHVLYAATETRA